MPITRFGVGNVAAAASGNVTPTLPASTAADDIAIIICCQADNVVSTVPAEYTIVDATNNNGLNNERVWWAWARLVGGDANPLITHTAGDSIVARIAVFRGVTTSGDPYSVKSVNSTGASVTATALAVIPTDADSMIVLAGGQADNSAWSGYSGTNPTFSEAIDNLTTLGTDASIFMANGIRTTADTTGDRTATATRSFQNVAYLIALKPPAAVDPRVVDRNRRTLQAVNRAGSW